MPRPAPTPGPGPFRQALARLAVKAASMVFPAFGGGSYSSNGMPAWGNANGSWFSYFLPGAKFDYAADAGDLWRNSAIAICHGWYADNFSEPKLEVVQPRRSGKEEPVENHDFLRLMEEPNPDYDADALWAATILSFAISGNAYWIKCKDAGKSRTLQVYWAPWWEIEPRWEASGKSFINHYDHVVDGKRIPLAKEDVVHFRRGLNPTNVRSGLPQLEPILREVCSDNSRATYTAGILRNWGVPRVVITPEDPNTTIEPDDANDLKQMWMEKTTSEEVGKPIVTSLRMKLQEMSASPDKMALDVIGRIPEARICAAWRLPAMVVGLSVGESQRTYANYAEARKAAYHDGLIPLQKRFARTLTKQLLPDCGGTPKQRACWDYSGVEAMAEDADKVASRAVSLYVGGLASFEEAREAVGKEKPRPGETFLLPKGLVPFAAENLLKSGEVAEDAAFWAMVGAAVTAGMPLEKVLKDEGWPEADIADITAIKAAETRAAMDLMNGGTDQAADEDGNPIGGEGDSPGAPANDGWNLAASESESGAA